MTPANRLLATDRWRALGQFVERWYERPLDAHDGHARADIDHALTRIGAPLPASLTEWFALVGRRLRAVQDSPRKLDDLEIEDGLITVWDENQGVWAIFARADGGDDPVCSVDDDSLASPNAPLSQTLLGMLVSDTLVGAWAGRGIGPLGELAASVRGGYIQDFTDDQVERLRAAYAPLPYPVCPFFPDPYRGHDTTVIRIEETGVQWMTATDAAFAALDAVLELRPAGGEHEVVVAFEGLSEPEQRYLQREYRIPNVEILRPALDGIGHIGKAVGGEAPRFHITTSEPHRVRDLVLATLPEALRPRLVIAARPIAVSVFEVLFPAGRAVFKLPA